MAKVIGWLRMLLGFGTPPVKAEAPQPVLFPDGTDPEEWLRETARFFDE